MASQNIIFICLLLGTCQIFSGTTATCVDEDLATASKKLKDIFETINFFSQEKKCSFFEKGYFDNKCLTQELFIFQSLSHGFAIEIGNKTLQTILELRKNIEHIKIDIDKNKQDLFLTYKYKPRLLQKTEDWSQNDMCPYYIIIFEEKEHVIWYNEQRFTTIEASMIRGCKEKSWLLLSMFVSK